jgi:hypothetical protein
MSHVSSLDEDKAVYLHNLAVTLALIVIFEHKVTLSDEVVEHLAMCFMEALKHLQRKSQ